MSLSEQDYWPGPTVMGEVKDVYNKTFRNIVSYFCSLTVNFRNKFLLNFYLYSLIGIFKK